MKKPAIVVAPIFMLFLLFACSAARGQAAADVKGLQEKYAQILGLPAEDVEPVELYQMLDHWPEYVRANPEKLKGLQHGVFTQFIYYLVYNIRIPSSIDQLYHHPKTSLFKNPAFLQSGDLMFFGKQADSPIGTVIYLQNQMVVYPGRGGELVFMSVPEVQQHYKVICGRISRDNQVTGGNAKR